MAEISTIRLNVALRELNISLDRAVEFLAQQNIEIEGRPTSKISMDTYQILLDEFETDKSKKDASHEISEEKRKEKESLRILQEKKEQERLEQQQKRQEIIKAKATINKPVTLGKIDLDTPKPKPEPTSPKEPQKAKSEDTSPQKNVPASDPEEKNETEEKPKSESKPNPDITDATPPTEDGVSKAIKTQYKTLSGPKKTGQVIDLDEFKKKEKGSVKSLHPNLLQGTQTTKTDSSPPKETDPIRSPKRQSLPMKRFKNKSVKPSKSSKGNLTNLREQNTGETKEINTVRSRRPNRPNKRQVAKF